MMSVWGSLAAAASSRAQLGQAGDSGDCIAYKLAASRVCCKRHSLARMQTSRKR